MVIHQGAELFEVKPGTYISVDVPGRSGHLQHVYQCKQHVMNPGFSPEQNLGKTGISKLVVTLFFIEVFPYFNKCLTTLGLLKLVDQELKPVGKVGYKGLGKTMEPMGNDPSITGN